MNFVSALSPITIRKNHFDCLLLITWQSAIYYTTLNNSRRRIMHQS